LPESAAPGQGTSSGSGLVTLDFIREAEAPWTQGAVPELEGRWRLIEHPVAGMTWTFQSGELIVERNGEERRVSPLLTLPGSPDRFRVPNGMSVRQGDIDAEYRFERKGDRLRVLGGTVVGPLLPDAIAPLAGFTYTELERIPEGAEATPLTAEPLEGTPSSTDDAARPTPPELKGASERQKAAITSTVPPELIGTWRLKTHVAASAPDAKVTFTKWTFDKTTLGMDASEQNRENRYEVLSSPDAPGTFQTYKFHEVPAGLAHEGSTLRIRYIVEAEGDRLRVAFGGGAEAPEAVAPGAGVIYYEFDRVAPEALAASKDSADDGAEAIASPAENPIGP
jgi:hypothetical protein